jgi:SAM-dependent methyltransferase
LPSAPAQAVTRGAEEHYAHPKYYERAYRGRDADVDFYATLAAVSGGPVLEYGVGTGRVALPIARAGIALCGVDRSQPMLAELRVRLQKEPELRPLLSLRRGDMRTLRLARRFALVTAPFNAVLHLYTRRDVERFLARVHAHLAPGGEFVFDYSMPRTADLAPNPERWYGGSRLVHPELGQTVRYAERFHYAPLTQVLSTFMRFTGSDEAHSAETLLTHRQFFPQELEALLHYNGFDSRWSADFLDRPPDSRTDTLVVHCRPRRGWLP